MCVWECVSGSSIDALCILCVVFARIEYLCLCVCDRHSISAEVLTVVLFLKVLNVEWQLCDCVLQPMCLYTDGNMCVIYSFLHSCDC